MVKRVLMLHGFAQNAHIFSKRVGAIRKECGNDIEFVFIDGPIILEPADIVGDPSNLDASQTLSPNQIDPTLTPRAWWNTDYTRNKAVGMEKSLEALKEVLVRERREGRVFDGVFGFSQGAAMAALLAALLERPDRYPPFLVDGESPHPPFQFCICISGFISVDPLANQIFSPPPSYYSTPTLHVIGRGDVIVSEERSRKLVGFSGNGRVEEHVGGHFVPSKANWRKFFAAYLKDPLGNVPSPGDLGSSAANSGTSTPVVQGGGEGGEIGMGIGTGCGVVTKL